jgi:hypothetical protein
VTLLEKRICDQIRITNLILYVDYNAHAILCSYDLDIAEDYTKRVLASLNGKMYEYGH